MMVFRTNLVQLLFKLSGKMSHFFRAVKQYVRGTSGQPELFSSCEFPDSDLLIANPPYIRTRVLGAEQTQLLSKNFGLKGRTDIYQAFLVAMNAELGIRALILNSPPIRELSQSMTDFRLLSALNLISGFVAEMPDAGRYAYKGIEKKYRRVKSLQVQEFLKIR